MVDLFFEAIISVLLKGQACLVKILSFFKFFFLLNCIIGRSSKRVIATIVSKSQVITFLGIASLGPVKAMLFYGALQLRSST